MSRAERLERARMFECVAEQTVAAVKAARERVWAIELQATLDSLRGRSVSKLLSALRAAQLADLEAQALAAVCSLELARRARERAETRS